jgi:coenzyme F420 hydrogenase subunit beta
MRSINEVVKSGLCLGCGLCTFDKSIEKTVFDNKRGQFVPYFKNEAIDNKTTIDVCPGKGYDIKNMSEQLFPGQNYSSLIGYYHKNLVGQSLDKEILGNASSGGIMTQLCLYLLDTKLVDKVIVTKFVYTTEGPVTKTFVTNQREEIIKSQGSKYCPVDISAIINEILSGNEKFAYIGTPCQVAGIRKLQKYNTSLRRNLFLAVANFCGGFKNYNNIKLIAKRSNIAYKDINLFNFRGGGKPTSLLMKDLTGKVAKIPYPDYVSYTGINGHLRCRLCVDATGELADISCGDAWLEKYKNNSDQWSFVICRSRFSYEIINEMKNLGYITAAEVESDEIIKSQNMNLNSKKVRYRTKFKIYHILGYKIPIFDGGYLDEYSSFIREIRIFLVGGLKSLLENIGLYWFLYRFLKKIKM